MGSHYQILVNDSVTVRPTVWGSDRKGTANEDMTGFVVETTFRF